MAAMDPNPVPVDRPTSRSGRESVAAWAEILTLLAVASFFAFSFFAGRVKNFLASYYVWLSIAAAIALFAMCIFRTIAHFRGYVSGDLEEKQSAWQVPLSVCVVILIVPIVLALRVNPTGFTSEGRRKRTVSATLDPELNKAFQWVLGRAGGGASASGGAKLPKKPTILDVITAVGNGHEDAVKGKFITVIGQCELPDGPESARFDIYRLVVTCCIADATAVSLEVSRRAAGQLENGGWVRVEGILEFDDGAPVIRATKTAQIPEPSEPFL